MPNDIEYVRVHVKGTDVEKSIPRVKWEASKGLFANVQKEAVNSNGYPLPDETVTASRGAKKNDDGQSADTTKES